MPLLGPLSCCCSGTVTAITACASLMNMGLTGTFTGPLPVAAGLTAPPAQSYIRK